MKKIYIAEKPSVAAEFAKALDIKGKRVDGYIESDDSIVTWCVGHLVTMSYPDKYDERLKKWSQDTLPFIPDHFLYEVIDTVKKQYNIVKDLLTREDVDTIYICTDSGREGEYIYRLVDEMAHVDGKKRLRVWIDSQTEDEIRRGVREAKDWSYYDALSSSAYLRAKEDYLMGINFSRALTLKYGNILSNFMKSSKTVISAGRVMTCVLGMVVEREREIREFTKTPFYKVIGAFSKNNISINCEWKAVEGSRYFESPRLYKDNGFSYKEDADKLIKELKEATDYEGIVTKVNRKKEIKKPPLLYNLAEVQSDCSFIYKISPDKTLSIIQSLYEKKLVTYPRTDARVLSTAIAKEIYKNISGLKNHKPVSQYADHIIKEKRYERLTKSRYVDDSKITDHYAIIPTGQTNAISGLDEIELKIYELICRRFLSIFLDPAEYTKTSIEIIVDSEHFFVTYKSLVHEGYLQLAIKKDNKNKDNDNESDEELESDKSEIISMISSLKKGHILSISGFNIKEGETKPPRRYSSGSIVLAMENAGKLIEDEELRSMIKGSGIGTSATRAEILKKLINIKYIALNNKTQILTPTLFGEMVYETVDLSIKPLLNPELTASWEKGLMLVSDGKITSDEYMIKLRDFIIRRTNGIFVGSHMYKIREAFDNIKGFYNDKIKSTAKRSSS